MKLSVIVTTYNRPDALVKVLDGLLSQTVLPHEIIIADDGSTDETAQAVKPFIDNQHTVNVIHAWHEDKGFRAAAVRNLAIRKSSGDYLVCLDGDCIPEKHFIEDHLALAREKTFFQGKRLLVGEKIQHTLTAAAVRNKFSLFLLALQGNLSNAHHLVRIPWFPCIKTRRLSGIRSCNMGFFKKDIVAVNGFNEDFSGWGREDSELAVRLYNLGLMRREHPFMAVCFHLWHPENDMSNLEVNNTLLKSMMNSGKNVCVNGLFTLRNDMPEDKEIT